MNALLTSTPTTATDNRIATLSEGDLTPLLTAWDEAHPAAAAVVMDLDWRHLLDEIAHPHTTQAFHRLAEAAA